ncbi:hypothetical protein SOASR029_32060 [Budvicia aquatica]|nr:hypothetical protein SOASR029_32060 [Budvicia aquatica]
MKYVGYKVSISLSEYTLVIKSSSIDNLRDFMFFDPCYRFEILLARINKLTLDISTLAIPK